jgi:CspA family cold shock protein
MTRLKSLGRVCQYDAIAGNGFILPDEGGGKIPFSYHDIQSNGYRALDEGERVEFVAVKAKRGVVAEKVLSFSVSC